MLRTISTIKGLIITIIIACSNICVAQHGVKIDIETIDNSNGLPVEEIRRIHQDREGLLWFATTNGLIRYDGYEFLLYKSQFNNPNLLLSNNILSISDDDRHIWVGTDNGLNRMDKETGQSDVVSPVFTNLQINMIAMYNNRLWLGTTLGLYSYEPQSRKIKLYTLSKLEHQAVENILVDSKDNLWVAASIQGLFRYDKESDRFIKYPDVNRKNSALTLFEDSDANLWVGSWGCGLTKISNPQSPKTARYTTFTHDPNSPNSISCDIIYAISQDNKQKCIWIGHRNGLSILTPPYDKGHFINYSFDGTPNNIANNDISAVIRDRTGLMWLGTMGGGINKVNLNSSKIEYHPLLQISKRLHSRYITAQHKVGNTLWLGVKNNGLTLLDTRTGTFRHSSEIEGMKNIPSNARIKVMFELNGYIWIGVYENYFYKIKLSDNRPVSAVHLTKKQHPAIIGSNPYSAKTDSKGNVWFGFSNGVSVMDSNERLVARSELVKDKIGRVLIQTIDEDKDGNIWLGSKYCGIFKAKVVDGEIHYEQYTKENRGINTNEILSIFVDSRNDVWVGTQGGGLSKLDKTNHKFVVQNKNYGISFEDIFNIFEDKQGYLWMCNHNALIRLHVLNSLQADVFASSDGLWNNVFTSECLVKSIDNESFIVGGMKGYNILNPQSIQTNNTTPPLVFTNIFVNHNSIFTTNTSPVFKYDRSLLTLKHKSDFAAEFSALNFANPKRNHYAYRLKGYDKRWNYVDSDQRRANYTNLPKGNYVLQVKATNEHGVWNDTPAELTVRVLPSAFDTWYAHLCYVLLLCLIVYITYRTISNRQKLKQQLLIANVESQQKEKLTQSKLRFFTNISHELLTPLTIIGCASDELTVENAHHKYNLSIIKNNVNRLNRLIRQILEFRKAENSSLKLQVSQGNLSKLIYDICENNFRILADKKNISFSVSSEPDSIEGWFDSDKIDKILYNLLSNAFKYNYDNSFVAVRMCETINREGIREAVIEVKDGGIGITHDNLEKIFEHFYDGAYRKSNTQGTGIGLALTKTLAELHNGSVAVASTLGSGSTFTITVPIDKTAYSEAQVNDDIIAERHIEQAVQIEKQSQTILVVEDNDELRTLIANQLQSTYNVSTATNGEEAIESLAKESFDMVISDIMMPVMDGIELCHNIKNNIEYSHIPVILLTAKTTEEDKIRGYQTGADAYISKPFKMELLLSRIYNLFRSRKSLIKNFTNSHESVQLKTITYTSIDEKLMKKAVEIVELNIANEDFNFNKFVDEMGVSKSMLYRKIKVLTGMAPSDFVKDIRLKNACKILKDKSVNISEVSYAVGFNQPKYFSQCFRKKYNMSPSEYRQLYAE